MILVFPFLFLLTPLFVGFVGAFFVLWLEKAATVLAFVFVGVLDFV